MSTKSFYCYLLAFLFVSGWWLTAFRTGESHLGNEAPFFERTTSPVRLFSYLHPLKREELHKALNGDFALMLQLITAWDTDAEILSEKGFQAVHRLARADFVKAQLLGRQLKTNLATSREARFLPQTFAAASILLAITPPEEIVALPMGFREQPKLFPETLLKRIPLDFDMHQMEALYLKKPHLAFVSNTYSHMTSIEALTNQSIPLFRCGDLAHMSEIERTLITIGTAVDRMEEAELLKLFVEATMDAIDNRILVLASPDKPHEKNLFLHYYGRYTLPRASTVTEELLSRLHINTFLKEDPLLTLILAENMPIDQELIARWAPDRVVVSAPNHPDLLRSLEGELKQIMPSTTIHFVDDTYQQMPSQHIVMAYFDLYEALK